LLVATLGLAQLAVFMSTQEEIMNKSMLEINYGIVATVAAAAAARCYMKFVRGPEPKSVDMSGKVVIVTGSNGGVGYETAKSLVNMGAHVIMACRSEEKAREAMANITYALEAQAAAIRGNTAPAVRGQMTFMKLDLSSLESVRAFVGEFKSSKLGLDSLVLNAGVMHSVRFLFQTAALFQTAEQCAGFDEQRSVPFPRGVTYYQRVYCTQYKVPLRDVVDLKSRGCRKLKRGNTTVPMIW
ncbi:unnamed protein product, partial [Laminaria digitata]